MLLPAREVVSRCRDELAWVAHSIVAETLSVNKKTPADLRPRALCEGDYSLTIW